MLVKLKQKPNFKNQDPFDIRFDEDIKKEIDNYWDEFIKRKDNFCNGKIIAVTNIDIDNNEIELGQANFSDLAYARNIGGITMRSLFTAILFKTTDNCYFIIKNNRNCISIIGGMADNNDFENSIFNPEKCLPRLP